VALLREALDRMEARILRRARDSSGGRRPQTARRLGISREGLYN
jgi:DNA-binding NtrC family response regulator